MLDSDKPSTGFKGFNSTGREDTTTEVLRPQVDPALARRRLILIAVVIAAICVLGYIAFQRSGLSLIPPSEERQGPAFTPGEQRVD